MHVYGGRINWQGDMYVYGGRRRNTTTGLWRKEKIVINDRSVSGAPLQSELVLHSFSQCRVVASSAVLHCLHQSLQSDGFTESFQPVAKCVSQVLLVILSGAPPLLQPRECNPKKDANLDPPVGNS